MKCGERAIHGWGAMWRSKFPRSSSAIGSSALFWERYNPVMAIRQVELTPEADPILDSMAESYGGDPNLALSQLLVAHECIESFLDEFESENSAELIRQRDQSVREFAEGRSMSWDQVKRRNGLWR